MSGVLVMDGTDSDEECLRSGALRQGFLCPFCVQDLGDQAVLHAHVRKCHPQSTGAASSDLAFCHLKDIFGKAKQKIMQIDAPFSVGSTTSTAAAAVLPYNVSGDDHPDASKFVTVSPSPSLAFSSQQFGITRNHTDYYLKCRAPCINDAAVRTNTLIIRLDKLINQCPADSNKRKAFERETVPWVMDRDVSKCNACCTRFSLTRRRHHCRLCGEVICHSCSKFLSFVEARSYFCHIMLCS